MPLAQESTASALSKTHWNSTSSSSQCVQWRKVFHCRDFKWKSVILPCASTWIRKSADQPMGLAGCLYVSPRVFTPYTCMQHDCVCPFLAVVSRDNKLCLQYFQTTPVLRGPASCCGAQPRTYMWQCHQPPREKVMKHPLSAALKRTAVSIGTDLKAIRYDAQNEAWWAVIQEWPSKFHLRCARPSPRLPSFHFLLFIACVFSRLFPASPHQTPV